MEQTEGAGALFLSPSMAVKHPLPLERLYHGAQIGVFLELGLFFLEVFSANLWVSDCMCVRR